MYFGRQKHISSEYTVNEVPTKFITIFSKAIFGWVEQSNVGIIYSIAQINLNSI